MLEKIHKALRAQKGFTLVELLVVVAIIAILAAFLLPRLLGYTNQARVSRAMSDLAAMRTVIEAYAADEGQGYYPTANNMAYNGIAKVLQAKARVLSGPAVRVVSVIHGVGVIGTTPNWIIMVMLSITGFSRGGRMCKMTMTIFTVAMPIRLPRARRPYPVSRSSGRIRFSNPMPL